MQRIFLPCLFLCLLSTCVRAQLFRGGDGGGGTSATFSGQPALPLTLISFTATPRDETVHLRWITQNEVATDRFTVERSQRGEPFTPVGHVEAAGNSTPDRQLTYDLPDADPLPGTNYYRLRSTDTDGSFTLSETVTVYHEGRNLGFSLSPNPVSVFHENVRLYLPARPIERSVHLGLFDTRGALVWERDYPAPTEGTLTVDLPEGLRTGAYWLRVTDETGQRHTEKLVIGR